MKGREREDTSILPLLLPSGNCYLQIKIKITFGLKEKWKWNLYLCLFILVIQMRTTISFCQPRVSSREQEFCSFNLVKLKINSQGWVGKNEADSHGNSRQALIRLRLPLCMLGLGPDMFRWTAFQMFRFLLNFKLKLYKYKLTPWLGINLATTWTSCICCKFGH